MSIFSNIAGVLGSSFKIGGSPSQQVELGTYVTEEEGVRLVTGGVLIDNGKGLSLQSATGGRQITIAAAASASGSSLVLQLPGSAGSSGQVLKINTVEDGVMSLIWSNESGGGGGGEEGTYRAYLSYPVNYDETGSVVLANLSGVVVDKIVFWCHSEFTSEVDENTVGIGFDIQLGVLGELDKYGTFYIPEGTDAYSKLIHEMPAQAFAIGGEEEELLLTPIWPDPAPETGTLFCRIYVIQEAIEG